MTLNQIVKRIQDICEAHLQLNTFVYARSDEFFASDAVFPGAFLKEFVNESGQKGSTTLPCELFFLDRVIQGGDTSDATFNMDEVVSDMREVAKDIFAQMRYQKFDPAWNVNEDFSLEYQTETDPDFLAGAKLSFTIKQVFNSDRCQVPTNFDYVQG